MAVKREYTTYIPKMIISTLLIDKFIGRFVLTATNSLIYLSGGGEAKQAASEEKKWHNGKTVI
jgi:hypothetical protein